MSSDSKSIQELAVRAGSFVAAGQPELAEPLYLRAIELEPANPASRMSLAALYHAWGRYDDAAGCLQEMLRLRPDNPRVFNNLGLVFHASGQTQNAVECFEKAITLQPDLADAHSNLGKAFQTWGRLDDAARCFQSALDITPGHVAATAGLAVQHDIRGQYRDGLRLIEALAVDGPLNPELAVTYANLKRHVNEARDAIPTVEAAMQQTSSVPELVHLNFALGDLLDDVGDYQAAFSRYRKANELKAVRFDSNAFEQWIEARTQIFRKSFLNQHKRRGQEGADLVFIVGMPRSGTSLTEQILAAHKHVRATGESNLISEFAHHLEARSPGLDQLSMSDLDDFADRFSESIGHPGEDPRRITDKTPLNFRHLGLIELLFPAARVVHCVRDSLDTAISCYFQNFSNPDMAFSFALENIGAYIAAYQRLMMHWQDTITLPLLQIRYEEIVDNPESATRELLEFLELEWDPACLRFYELDRTVTTASYAQVRQPVYTKSVGHAAKYDSFLGRLKARLTID